MADTLGFRFGGFAGAPQPSWDEPCVRCTGREGALARRGHVRPSRPPPR